MRCSYILKIFWEYVQFNYYILVYYLGSDCYLEDIFLGAVDYVSFLSRDIFLLNNFNLYSGGLGTYFNYVPTTNACDNWELCLSLHRHYLSVTALNAGGCYKLALDSPALIQYPPECAPSLRQEHDALECMSLHGCNDIKGVDIRCTRRTHVNFVCS